MLPRGFECYLQYSSPPLPVVLSEGNKSLSGDHFTVYFRISMLAWTIVCCPSGAFFMFVGIASSLLPTLIM